jgi:superkiller protein 3
VIGGETNKLEKAINLNPYEVPYKLVIARDYLSKVIAEAQKPPEQIDMNTLSKNVNLAITYAKGGIINQNTIKGATELSPQRVDGWETLGMIYRDIQGLTAGALNWGIKSFETAISLEPVNPALHTELGKLYLASNDIEKAKTEFKKAKELKPDYVDALIQDALIYEKENNLDEAIREMEAVVQNFPLSIEARFQLGRLYFNKDKIDEAISQFETAISLAPNYSNALYSLGVAYQKKGETEKALAQFEKVLELNPGNKNVIQKIEELKKTKEQKK